MFPAIFTWYTCNIQKSFEVFPNCRAARSRSGRSSRRSLLSRGELTALTPSPRQSTSRKYLLFSPLRSRLQWKEQVITFEANLQVGYVMLPFHRTTRLASPHSIERGPRVGRCVPQMIGSNDILPSNRRHPLALMTTFESVDAAKEL